MEEKKLEVPQQTPADLYLMVTKNLISGPKVTLLSVKKIKSFTEIAPTKEILITHFQAEHVRMQIAQQEASKAGKDANYLPQPLYLQIQSSIFANIVAEARAKNKDVSDKALTLTLGSNMPCCIITPISEFPTEQPQPKDLVNEKSENLIEND